MVPGEIIVKNKEIVCNAGKRTKKITVSNTGDRPIQVGSHFHFFEVNKALEFDRKAAFGMRLDIASGTAVRFEPGEEKEITLVEIGGNKEIHGFSGLTEGNISDDKIREKSFKTAKELGFKGAE
ncbi:urease subunit beta [Clostridium guangxiense]|uniref:urease subunit beta n=1 Tax=Clostridium guangxiense TaxID=1662055 RepID=UPI001E28B0F1|nr:urease subunit beta [Clostridium guangxiense]MCD2346105.1 urease subunit beta [Clostridium guangxiense]